MAKTQTPGFTSASRLCDPDHTVSRVQPCEGPWSAWAPVFRGLRCIAGRTPRGSPKSETRLLLTCDIRGLARRTTAYKCWGQEMDKWASEAQPGWNSQPSLPVAMTHRIQTIGPEAAPFWPCGSASAMRRMKLFDERR